MLRSLITTLFLLIALPLKASDDPKFILIHLDAGSSFYVQDEMAKGNLPNLKEFFGEDGLINYTITYFPSKTPTVISSLRDGLSPDDAVLPGWKRPSPYNGRTIGMIGTFLDMAFSKSRLSMTNLIYGLPAFHWMAGPALVNSAYYLQDYDVIQFYWYNVDTQGHFNGEEAFISELIEFDRQFGKLIRRLDDDVNVVIYSDHGMTFGQGVEIDPVIEEILGDDLAIFSYPTLYLEDSSLAEYYAIRLVDETEIDFTFIEDVENGRIIGFHNNGKVILNIDGDLVNYEFEGEDLLGYYSNGYKGEYLNREGWLKQSYNSKYPMAPISLKTHMNNPSAGDIITLFGKNKYHQTGYSRMGNHGGFTYQDMTTPLFLRGSEVEELRGREYYWLPDLFSDLSDIDFESRPQRERHTVTSRYDFRRDRAVSELSFSPIYRVRYGANFYMESGTFEPERVDIWGKTDIFRSYLNRMWIGTGVELSGGDIKPMLMFQQDLHIRKFVFQSSIATNRQFYFRTSYEATPWLAIESVNFNSLGVRFDF
ncbi:MAG: alkaline phosphatase family protein [Balneolaceae bacterium]|nr:alkaline phosphatase family protein [Balneolaceae bacterium]MCH8547532.1 alkaline phosphatase family protein [Balneolaceae bacterium]